MSFSRMVNSQKKNQLNAENISYIFKHVQNGYQVYVKSHNLVPGPMTIN